MQREFFFNELGHPQRICLLFRLRSSGPRQYDYRQFLIATANVFEDRNPIHLRPFQVQHHGIGMFSAKELQALPTIFSKNHFISLPAEESVEEISAMQPARIT